MSKPEDKEMWLDDDEIDDLLEWFEDCTLAELIRAKEIIMAERTDIKQ